MTLFVFPQRLRRQMRTVLMLCGLAFMGLAQAQSWPQKPIRVIVNFPPGGAADQIARAVAQPLGEALGQTVVVENRGGANGNIGGEAVAKSAADGHTLLMSSGGMVSINPHLYNKMPFDPVKDLVPVAAAARVLVFLEVRPGLQINDFKTFLDFIKANPGKLSFGSPGNGSSPQLAGEMMKAQSNTFAVHVPYRGAAPAMQDLLAGQIDFLFDPGIGLQHVRSGKLKMLAVGSLKRSPLFPDVPTLDELGLKGFDADSWFGFYAPAGTPAATLERLQAACERGLQRPPVVEGFQRIATPIVFRGQGDFGRFWLAELEKFRAIVQAAGIRPGD